MVTINSSKIMVFKIRVAGVSYLSVARLIVEIIPRNCHGNRLTTPSKISTRQRGIATGLVDGMGLPAGRLPVRLRGALPTVLIV